MLKDIPRKIARTCLLLKGLDPKKLWSLALKIIYLYREFAIITNIEAVVKEFTISFYYKDNILLTFKTETLDDLAKVIDNIEQARTGEDK